MGALASQATFPFIELQYAYKCPLPLSKMKCTKVGHEDPKTQQVEKRGNVHPRPRQCYPRGFRVYYVNPSMHKKTKVTEGYDLPQSKTWSLHNNIWKIKTKTKPDRQLNAAKAGRRMPHPPNGYTLQTWAPDTNYYPRLALVPSPLIRAGKKSIYANRINTITYLTAPLIIRKD